MKGCQLGGYFMVLVNDAVAMEDDVMSAGILLVFWI